MELPFINFYYSHLEHDYERKLDEVFKNKNKSNNKKRKV